MKRKNLTKLSQSVETGLLEQRRISVAEELERWLIRGDVARLESLILQGKSELLKTKTSPHVKTRAFLKSISGYAQAVDTFLSAVVAGNLQSVKEMAAYKHASLATHPATGANALHLAAIWGQLDVLRLLVRILAPTLINDRDMEGRTSLHYAAAYAGGDESKIAFYDVLVTHGASEDAVDSEGYSPANYLRNPELLDFSQVQGLNKYPLSTGDAVDQLIARRNVEALEDILLSGEHALLENRIFPPGTEDLQGILHNLTIRISAIHEAIRDGDDATFKHLVDKKRLACARDQDGRTPLHSAVLHDHPEIANFLLLVFPHCVDQTDKRNWGGNGICANACMRYLILGNFLASSNATADDKGRTAFHYTCCLPDTNKQETFSRLLLGAGANRTIRDSNGHSASYYQKHTKSARRLYDAVRYQPPPPEVTIMTDEATSPTHVNEDVERQVLELAETEDYHRLETLMHEGKGDEINKIARKHTKNKAVFKLVTGFRSIQSRLKAAMEAVDDADMRKVKSLVDKKPVAEARDSRGFGILHVAVFRERHEIVELLAKTLPVCMSVVDHHGRTALHYAATQQNAIYDTLVDAGADANLPDNDGVTPEEYRRTPDKMPRPSSAITEFSSIVLTDLPHATVHMLEDPIYDPDAPAQDLIDEWLADGETDHLEQLVLDGRGQLLIDRKSSNPASAEFLRALIQYQAKIDAIHKAVEDGDVRRVKSLIDRVQLATSRDRQGLTPLHKAILHGQTNTVRYLLARYPSIVNATDHMGRTPLHYATADPNGDHFIKMLQKAGGDAFIEDKHGHTPFYYRTHPRGMNLRTLKDNAVMNQLMTGELSRPLLQDLEEDITDWLHTGNIGKLEELVLNGYADLLLGRTHEVEDINAVAFLEILPQYQAKIQAIHKAVQSGNLRSVKLLTDRKKLALCRDARGLSPLHNAIVFDKPDIAKYLVRNYPQSVNAMDHNKRTPLHYAAALRDGGYLYKVMRKAGADPNILDCNARPAKYYLRYPGELDLMSLKMDTKTALKHVLHNRVAPSYLESNIQQWLREGNVNKLEQLVLSGCGDLLLERKSTNPDASEFLNDLEEYLQKIDNIHKAVREGDMRQFKQLVDRRRLAMARDRKGCTPLHDAIVYEQTDIVRYIASNYSTVLNAPDYNKRTPMHYSAAARDGGHYLKILSKAGADPMAVDNEGRTPDYYRRNPGILDLKLIRERDQDIADVLVLNEHIFEENADNDSRVIDSRLSDADSVLTTFSSQRDEDTDDAARTAFEAVLNERVEAHLRMTDRRTLPATENGLYLARTVGPILTKALAEVVIRRPSDPITFISDWLYRYHEENAVRWDSRLATNEFDAKKIRQHRSKRTNRMANGDSV